MKVGQTVPHVSKRRLSHRRRKIFFYLGGGTATSCLAYVSLHMCWFVPCDHPGINSRTDSFMFPNLLGTVPSPCVLVCVQALHNNTKHKAALPEL